MQGTGGYAGQVRGCGGKAGVTRGARWVVELCERVCRVQGVCLVVWVKSGDVVGVVGKRG